jgi:tetratricopeptide (TPR) repeat protein
MILNNLGNLLAHQDRHDEAEPLLERSLKLLDKKKADPNALAPALNNLAVTKKELGKLDEALMLYERSLGVMEGIVGGTEHPLLLPILRNLAILYKTKGWTDEAAETEARIRKIQSRPD